MELNRRNFIAGGALLAAAGAAGRAVAEAAPAATPENPHAGPDGRKYEVGEPCLQVPAETSMGVCWAVSHLTNGWVEYGQKEDLSDAKVSICEGAPGITGFDEYSVRVRLADLKPATKYYYRAVSQQIFYKDNYHRDYGEKIVGKIHSFETLGASQRAHFCVINDTHAQWTPFKMVIDKVKELAPATVVWNGDASNLTEKPQTGVQIFLKPKDSEDFATDIPYLWVDGNHDFRGIWNRYLDRLMMTRLPTERSSRDWALTRNFAVRLGDIAMIGLDTGEDKPDSHPQFHGLVASEQYRVAQTAWLADALERPDIKSAPFVVAFLHIPLFDSDPTSHPGDIPDNGGGKYRSDFAYWQKQCHDLWSPLLEKHGVQLVIAAHQHRYRYDAPTADRSWAQIVGGGPELGIAGHGKNRRPDDGKFPTVVEGKVDGGKLVVTVHDVLKKRVAGAFEYAPRKV